MGNYKSRPSLSCADEFKKRISECYSLVRSRLCDDVNPRWDEKNSVFQICFLGSIEEFVELLNSVSVDDKVGSFSLLHLITVGISDAQSKKIDLLLEKCDDDAKRRSLFRQRTPNNFNVLHCAVYKGDCAVIETLLKNGADVNHYIENAPSPLHLAAMCGNPTVIDLLIRYGADLHSKDLVQFSPLHCAVYFGQEKAVKALLSLGSDPNYCGGVQDRPLHVAAGKASLNIVKLLLNAGADLSLADDEGNTPIHFASSTGQAAILATLLAELKEKQKMILETTIYGDTPLHVACYHGKLEAAKMLLPLGGSSILKLENVFHETILQAACTSGKSLELVAFLLRQPGIDPNHQSQDGHTALHSACYHGHIRIVQYLLDNQADQSLTAKAIEMPSPEKKNTVASAMMALGRLESVTSSDSGRFSNDDQQPTQQTPILWAYERGHDQIVALLKYYANKRPESDVCSEYSSGDSSYTPLPSPMGRLRSITKEKTEILQLRTELDSASHLSLVDIEIKGEIGQGSFGKVYKGVFKGKTVAVKRYRALAFGSKSEVDIFCREVNILCHLNHPNVIAFVGACLDDPSQFAIITEFVAAGSLYKLLHKEKRVLNLKVKLGIAIDVAKGMQYLHEVASRAVIHRDLNSHNILLHSNGRAVIADFGESRFISEDAEENMTKQPGNLRWMAPEVFTQCCQYDEKVDVFSYALMVWELHSAELPFGQLKPAAAAAEMAYKKSRPILPSEPTAQFPKHIIDVIQQGWNPNPAARPTFSQILEDLAPFAPSEEERRFVCKMTNDDSTDEGEYSDFEDFDFTELPKSVSKLKSQFEQLNTATPKATSSHGVYKPNGVVEKLRQQLDNNGYVSQAARSIQAAKSAAQLRDSIVLSREVKVAQRQSAFKEHDQQSTGNFTSSRSLNSASESEM
ncbi:unnamed protein product [Bursaphelenchus okinawaensis]|uniref:Protein kinase domain-containing protein n=1 Tax=Bursaphelenchus okinawaensis TaxID=465554 RepID=A0A811KGV2_9BILA|nr:unnamed protein product [Bursaphelenchus okinawaensis]CAG9103046.1 unnamed protein product [Bursaphelenchus okinawaensis]